MKETAAIVRTLVTKPISPPSYFTLLSQQLSLLLPEKKTRPAFWHKFWVSSKLLQFSNKIIFYRFLRKCFFAGDSCLYVTAALAIDTDTSAGGKDLIYIGYYYPVVVPAYWGITQENNGY